MAPGGEMFRYPQHFGENVLPRGSHEWLPYSVDEVRLKSSNTNLSGKLSEAGKHVGKGDQPHSRKVSSNDQNPEPEKAADFGQHRIMGKSSAEGQRSPLCGVALVQ